MLIRFILISFLLVGIFISGQTTIFHEDWDGSGPGITGWTIIDEDNEALSSHPLNSLITNAWVSITEAQIDANTTQAYSYPLAATGMSGNVIGASSDHVSLDFDAANWLISPSITIPANATGVTLKWAAQSLGTSVFLENYVVYVSTNGNSTSDFTTVLLDVNNELNTGNYRSVSLDAYIGNTINIAFKGDSFREFVVILDNIGVYSENTLSNHEDSLNQEILMEIYPTQTSSSFMIKMKDSARMSETIAINVYSLQGALVKSFSALQSSYSIEDLEKGVYLVLADINGTKLKQKIVKK